ncbi:unnamed protein product [Symbiodinium natans]|uniref:Uncharacterized protein n=1 Tax=Symbiodinium natans TaxID=878477 RepID=A0A812M4H3_9DINO|nr:unnamed protein product [Symbiodinium natans]
MFSGSVKLQEKCKHCGRSWTEHKGVISEAHLQTFLQQKQKSQEDKDKKEAEAKHAAAAKKLAKKRASQAVEDDWLFGQDAAKDEPPKLEDDSDDDLGFRMFSAADFVNSDPGPPEPNRQLKVVNLIDWGECDVAQELAGAGEATGSSASTMAPPVEARHTPPDPRGGGEMNFQESFGSAPNLAPVPQPGNQDLLTEIQHLRQMLADANEEKDIQVAIVRDEVLEKQQQIQELTRQKSETEALLREARQKIENDASHTADAAVPEQLAEVQQLRAHVAEAEAKLEAWETKDAATSVEIQQLRARVAETEAQLEGQKPHDQSEVLHLRARADEAEALLKALQQRDPTAQAEANRGDAAPQDQTSEVEQLKVRAAQAEERLQALQQKDVDSSAELQQLRVRAAEAEAQLEAMKHEQQAKQAELEAWQKKDAATSAEVQQLKAQAAEAQAKLEASQATQGAQPPEEPSAEVQLLRVRCAQAEDRLEALQQKDASSSAEVVQLRARLSEAEAQLEALQRSTALPEQHAEDAQAAKALRDVRMHAEQQLAWILQRMGVTHQAAELQKVGRAPCV